MTSEIDPQISMGDLEAAFPGARRALFRRYHIGGCASCGFQPSETLAEVCVRNGNLAVEEVIGHVLSSHEADLKIEISPEELKQQRQAEDGEKWKVVDVRMAEEYEAARIEGSLHFSQEMMQEMLGHWDKNSPVVFVDHKGERSIDAAAYFAGHGFENVRCLRGGIDAWSRDVDSSIPRYSLE